MRFSDGTHEFDLVDQDKLMWAEAAAVERVTGMTMAELTAKGQVCGCGHRLSEHQTPEGKPPKCKQCGCDTPMENLSIEVQQAFLWISMKRVYPELSFKDVGQLSMASLVEIEAEPDPTGADEATPAT
jgi:hypothetical protein